MSLRKRINYLLVMLKVNKKKIIFIILGFVINSLANSGTPINPKANDTFKMIISSAKEAGNSNSEKKLLEDMGITSPVIGLNTNLNENNEAYQTMKKSYNTAAKNYFKQLGDKSNPDLLEKCMNANSEKLFLGKYQSCDNFKTDNFFEACRDEKDCTANTLAQGNDKFIYNTTENFSHATAYMGILSQMQNTIDNDPLMIFKGTLTGCIRSKLGALGKNCCDIKLMHSQSGLTNSCDEREVRLAASRRAARTHKIGQYCAAKSLFGCIKYKEVFCEFPTALSRIIQEQGRKQINDLAIGLSSAVSQNTITQQINWPFTSKSGHWSTTEVNGTTVAMWSWPEILADEIPVTVFTSQSLIVPSGGSSYLEGISISLDCGSKLCKIQLAASGKSQEFQFMPACGNQQPERWRLKDVLIEQDQCVLPNTQPKNWPKIIWRDNAPSLWKFKVRTASSHTITSMPFNWQISAHIQIGGNGNCDANMCNYQINILSNDKQYDAAFIFPRYCTVSDKYAVNLNDITIRPECTNRRVVFAICSHGNNCGDLPADPSEDIPQEVNSDWQIFNLPQTQNTWLPLSEDVFLLGSCLNNNCLWQIRLLDRQGIASTVTDNVRWNLLAYTKDILQTNFGMLVQPYAYTANQYPNYQLIRYQLPAGTWQEISLPLAISKNNPITIHDSPKITAWGNCLLNTGECSYHFTGEVSVTAMPWGDAKHPHCQGFTPQQLLLINWTQLDLTEYLNKIQNNSVINTQKDMQFSAENDVSTFQQAIQEGKPLTVSLPNSQEYIPIRVSPLEGKGPFTITAQLTSNWPQYFNSRNANIDPVEKVQIYWGDGMISQLNRGQLISINNMPIYNVQHQYGSPPGKNIIEHIIVNFYTKTAVHQAAVDVANYWETPDSDPAVGSGGYVNIHKVQINDIPGFGRYNPNTLYDK